MSSADVYSTTLGPTVRRGPSSIRMNRPTASGQGRLGQRAFRNQVVFSWWPGAACRLLGVGGRRGCGLRGATAVPFGSLVFISLCSMLLASESNKIGKTPLCAFCGSDTFACGTMEQVQEQGDSQTLPSTNHSRLGLLNSKVHRQVLLSLNRSQQTFNSTNCTCIPDCPNLADEIDCPDKPICSVSEFSCFTNSKCISKSLYCDGINHCGDNSDEIDCKPRDCDMTHETKCDNGRCIPSEWLCDQWDDCGDMSDERCFNACSSGQFQCHSGDQCLPMAQFCDNVTQCYDKSDELNCQTALPTTDSQSSHISCPLNDFMCSDGLCIKKHYRCDQHQDCADGSDEQECDEQFAEKCRPDEVLCANGQCAPEESSCLNKAESQCETGSNGECIDQRNECSNGNFRCRDGSCVSLDVLCDGRPDCRLDGSDEDTNSTCIAGVVPCRENGLPCQHLCVATTMGHACVCKDGYRKGSDGRSCIDVDECHIGSLTGELDYHFTLAGLTLPNKVFPNIQVCSQHCANSVPGFQCSCAKGYRLEADKQRCTAIQGPDPLLLVAWNADSFSVSLLGHFTRYYHNDNSLNFIEEETFELKSIESLKPKIFLDYLYSKKRIFWSDSKTKKIFSALFELNQESLVHAKDSHTPWMSSLRLHNVRPLLEISGLDAPAGIAADWINERLYWCDIGRIEYSNLDGTMRKVLLHQFVHKPNSIVIHPEENTLFWSDWGEPPRIERAFLDGSARQVIVSSLLSLPSGLVVDLPASKLYWVDVQQNMIECSNLDGSSRFIVTTENVRHPVSLSIFEDTLYWSSINSAHVQSISKLRGRNVTTTMAAHSTIERYSEFDVELKVLHPLRQPDLERPSPCHTSPCSHICLPANTSYRCKCPFGYSFEENSNRNCQIDSNPLLLFTHRNDIRAVTLNKQLFISEGDIHYNDFNLAHVLPIAGINYVVSFDYDPISSVIFWSDMVTKSIGRAKWLQKGSHQEMIVHSLESPGGVAYDWAADVIYWTDTGRGVIEVARGNGSFRSLLVWRSLDQPRDIVLDPVSAVMFWSQWSNQTSSIERSGMDGSFRMLLHSSNLTRPHGLALDHLYRRIYWVDSARARIECSFYDGTDRQSVVWKGLQYPFAVAIAGEFLYWSDLHQRNVQKAHKMSGDMHSILFEDTDHLMDIAVLQQNRSVLRSEFAFTNGCKKAKCSHLCLLSPQPPGFKCACPTGITLKRDALTCADDMSKYLIFTTRKAIRRISLQGEHHFDVNIPIEQPMENAFVLDLHSQSNMVFWSDTSSTRNVIYRASMLTGKSEAVVRYGLLSANGLAVDEVGEKLYWTDAGRKRIEVANLDGSFRRVIISQDLDSPRAIAVHHKSGHIVWADWGAQARIERADMDGSRRALLVGADLGWPNGIAITASDRIIWADSKMHTIEMVDMNGANRRKLLQDLPSPYGVALIDGYLYWTDWHSKTINRMYLSSSEGGGPQVPLPQVEVFARSLSNLVDVRAVDHERRETPSLHQQNMCQISNGGCSHLCLRNSAPGYACLCPTGMTLREDGKTCNELIYKQLLLASKTSLHRISLDSAEYDDVYLPVSNLRDVVSVDYHFASGQIFYIDAALKEIRSLQVGNLSQLGAAKEAVSRQVIVFSETSQPSSLVVDWLASNLYWSDHERHLIEVARFDGSSRKVLIDLNVHHPRCLQLLPETGFLFWLDATDVQQIERAFLDGDGRVTLLTSNTGQMNGLTVDRGTGKKDEMARLFWADAQFQRIESIQIDGTKRQVVLSKGLTQPYAVAIAGEFIYWSDTYNKVIERANRRTLSEYRVVADNLESLREMRLVSPIQQNFDATLSSNASVNPCAVDNGACSHLCLFRPNGYICACPSYPDPRPCSTVPGEIIPMQPIVTASSANKITEFEDVSRLFNSSFLPTENIPNWNNAQPDEKNEFPDKGLGNESLRLKELTDLCQESLNLTRCNSSRFIFDDHIIQVAYVLALILLSAAVLVCAILTFFCKRFLGGNYRGKRTNHKTVHPHRKLMEEEMKLPKVEGNSLPRGSTVSPKGARNSSAALSNRHYPRSSEVYSQMTFLANGHHLPPIPPPIGSRMLAPSPNQQHTLYNYELSHAPPHLWFSPSHVLLDTAPPYQANFMVHDQLHNPRFQWSQTMPRPSSSRPRPSQQHRSAMNSPYLANNRQRGGGEPVHMNYLCLESSKLETDI